MDVTKESIDEAIKQGDLARCRHPQLSDKHYFVNRDGVIISYNDVEPKQLVSHPGKGGENYISLFTNEGLGRFTLAELVASAFLDPPPGDNYHLVRKDGDLNNNAPDNLVWEIDVRMAGPVTMRQAEKEMPRPQINGRTPDVRKETGKEATTKRPTAELPRHAVSTNDIEQNQLVKRLRRERDEALAHNRRLLEALQPFATFDLPINLHLETKDAIVFEANVGYNNHCVVHVSDFVRAADAFGD